MLVPLIAGYPMELSAVSELRQGPWELQVFGNRARMMSTELSRPPRLFLIQATHDELAQTREAVQGLRREWPLVDVIVWIPKGSGSAVRELFRAGAGDVVATQNPSKLVESVAETLTRQRILPRLEELTGRRNPRTRFDSMVSCSPLMWKLFDLCAAVAMSEATVLITGETGTGKELIAKALHRRSGRAGRFVPANCASLPGDLLQSELFGHEKGAFTGADRAKKGLVQHADGGTLFLDEIGDMPAEAQQSLLRLIQERKIRRVGGTSELAVDMRVVAATHVELTEAVAAGRFREDLYYRLDVIRLEVPALRHRPEDIVLLFGHFTKRLAKHYGLNAPAFTDRFLDALVQYDWPGNVRQLENFCERLVLARPQRALTERSFADLKQLPSQSFGAIESTSPKLNRSPIDLSLPLAKHLQGATEQLERDYLEALLKAHHGKIAEAAEQAGISRRTLLRKMNLYQLDKREYRR